jgi:hypothetical protein
MNRYITILVTLAVGIMFNGCNLDTTDQFNQKSSKEVLTSNVWYYIDKPAEQYIISEFTNNRVTQNHYEDGSFSNLLYKKKYTATYHGNIIYLNDEYGEHVCDYTTCENKEWILVSCDAGTVYIEGWKTKGLAFSHTAN